MPVLLVVLFALFGVGYFAREELKPKPVLVEPATIAPDHASWARACQGKLAEAAHEFEGAAQIGCGQVTISTLPSGVDYVEYNLRASDGSVFQVSVTEEPQNDGEATGWRGSPGCHGYTHGFEVVRHEHGRLAMVSVKSPAGLHFSRVFEPAADFCVEQAQ